MLDDLSSDHLIRPYQNIRRHRQADLFRCFQIDDELELDRLLDGKVGGLCAFQNFVNVAAERRSKSRAFTP